MKALISFSTLLLAVSCCTFGVGQNETDRAADCPWQLAGSGTAWPIDCTWSDGRQAFEILMLTARHVAQGLQGPVIAYHRDGRQLAGEVLHLHPAEDAALVLFLSPEPVETIEIDFRPLQYGERVTVPGYQGMELPYIVEGFASGEDQIGVDMWGGGSGSPVLDQAGQARALVTAISCVMPGPMQRIYIYHHCQVLPLYRIAEWLEEKCSE